VKIFNPAGVNFSERMNANEPSWLVSECIAGNHAAIEMLVRQYEAGVFRLAYAILGDEADAREVAQETFIAALKALKTYQEKKTFKAWLYTIALNLSRSRLRKRKVIERLKATIGGIFRVETQKQATPEDQVIQTEQETALWHELNKLDERHRTVVVLRYFHDLPIAEIAEIMEIHEGTVHSRLHTARERLRNALLPFNGE
jgi:RNA polymerase sigma-70 factor (ECF subfamily)